MDCRETKYKLCSRVYDGTHDNYPFWASDFRCSVFLVQGRERFPTFIIHRVPATYFAFQTVSKISLVQGHHLCIPQGHWANMHELSACMSTVISDFVIIRRKDRAGVS